MMRWPLVSREAYDRAVEAEHRAHLALATERERYDALLARYHDAVAPPHVLAENGSTSSPNVPRARSAVAEAIRAEAAGEPRLAAYLYKRARELRSLNPRATDEEIAGELARWD